MLITKVTREYGRTMFLEADGRQRGSITAKASIESDVKEGEDAHAILVALEIVVEDVVEKSLEVKLREFGYIDS
jgi:hypothetical protein